LTSKEDLLSVELVIMRIHMLLCKCRVCSTLVIVFYTWNELLVISIWD